MLKRTRFYPLTTLSLFFFLLTLHPSAHALMYRILGPGDLSSAARTGGSMAFKGKVLGVETKPGSQEVSFLIQDVIRGNLRSGSQITLSFLDFNSAPRTGNLRLRMGGNPPRFQPNEETVVFVTLNADGKCFFIGGEDQSRFYVKNIQGRSFLWNRMGNKNIINVKSTTPLVKHIIKDMQNRQEGSIAYDDFKKLLDESE